MARKPIPHLIDMKRAMRKLAARNLIPMARMGGIERMEYSIAR